jgi:hypothetical protein
VGTLLTIKVDYSDIRHAVTIVPLQPWSPIGKNIYIFVDNNNDNLMPMEESSELITYLKGITVYQWMRYYITTKYKLI